MNALKKITSNRLLLIRLGLTALFLGVLGRFYYVQIIEGEQYTRQSEKNRIRQISIAAPRGLILDRYGKILVDNLPAYSIYAIPNELSSPDSVFALLGEILGRDPDELQETFRTERRGPFQPVKLARHVDFSALARLEEHKLELPGLVFDVEPRRFYPAGVSAPHVFGYLGELSEQEFDELAPFGYERGDVIGKKGVEKYFERLLHGQKGYQYVEVNALGREIKVLADLKGKEPQPGQNLRLALDADLQEFIEEQMADKEGGAVVLNARNGEVLALVSKPDYDLDLFSRPISQETWNALINDPRHPLYDRMVQSLYPPGSTYKLILAIAGLETGLINPDEIVNCPGFYRLGRRKFACWKTSGHGPVNLERAIEQSCNVYFWRMMQKVGLENWVTYSRKFYFGRRTGIDLSSESTGLVPDSSYFNMRYGKGRWSRGLLLNLAVGQGDLLVTPLQMATFAMAIANRGVSFRPRLRSLESESPDDFENPDTLMIDGISEQTWDFIHHAMYLVVNGRHGTAGRANPGKIKVAGKTGTAENPHGDNHAWFIGFAPFDDPQLAFAVFLENGGGGGANAAPIAGAFLDFLIRKNRIALPEKQVAIRDSK